MPSVHCVKYTDYKSPEGRQYNFIIYQHSNDIEPLHRKKCMIRFSLIPGQKNARLGAYDYEHETMVLRPLS